MSSMSSLAVSKSHLAFLKDGPNNVLKVKANSVFERLHDITFF